MMNTGVSFQPGASDGQSQTQGRSVSPTNSVQEAIKVLSLRLPKVLGARSIAPSPLVNSPGSDGNTRVDSVVNQIMSRMFPTAGGGAPEAPAPMIPQNQSPEPTSNTMPIAPTFGGVQSMGGMRREAPSIDTLGTLSPTPRVVFDNPNSPSAGFSQQPQGPRLDGSMFQPSTIAPDPQADLWRRLQQTFQPPPDEPQMPFAI